MKKLKFWRFADCRTGRGVVFATDKFYKTLTVIHCFWNEQHVCEANTVLFRYNKHKKNSINKYCHGKPIVHFQFFGQYDHLLHLPP